uniref:Uncharacterized protein n=1 Tax=Magnetococcus massalia (strain MO-1) TaxID=451514 RepID=A0A1S7LGN8_MAGMO|nr:protein of unknown function [Candidatus Magnetococcus massalia]
MNIIIMVIFIENEIAVSKTNDYMRRSDLMLESVGENGDFKSIIRCFSRF